MKLSRNIESLNFKSISPHCSTSANKIVSKGVLFRHVSQTKLRLFGIAGEVL